MQKKPYEGIALTAEQTASLDAQLRSDGVINDRYTPPVFPGCVAVRGDILDRAATIAQLFYRACKTCHEQMQTDAALKDALTLPFQNYPALLAAILGSPFWMEYFRIDFYLHPQTLELSIIEANTSPGALPEHGRIDTFFGEFLDTSPPHGAAKLQPGSVIRALKQYVDRVGGDVRTFGLIARDDGGFFPLAEANLYSPEVRAVGWEPVLCTIEDGITLDLFREVPQSIDTISDLDALFHNPGNTMQHRETFTRWLAERGIMLLPPRSNMLFTNKSFLTVLSRMDHFEGLTTEEFALLHGALIPCFPLAELEEHLPLVRDWTGVVVKRNLGSSGANVKIFDYAVTPVDEALRELRKTQEESMRDGSTWTVQQYIPPPSIKLNSEPFSFDIMTYALMGSPPQFLFSSRPFRDGKANIRFGAFYGQICRV